MPSPPRERSARGVTYIGFTYTQRVKLCALIAEGDGKTFGCDLARALDCAALLFLVGMFNDVAVCLVDSHLHSIDRTRIQSGAFGSLCYMVGNLGGGWKPRLETRVMGSCTCRRSFVRWLSEKPPLSRVGDGDGLLWFQRVPIIGTQKLPTASTVSSKIWNSGTKPARSSVS